MKRFSSLLFVSLLAFMSSTALADNMDPVITGFVKGYDSSGNAIPDNDRFTSYAGELGAVIAPKFLSPANTLGSYGFDISWEMSFTHINSQNKYWQMGATNPPQFAKTMQLHFEKGLPFSLQLGGIVSHVFQSGLWGLAMDLKWAFVEGFKYVPDFSVSAFVGTLLGSKDLAILNAGMNLMISKPFTVGGVMVITPYAGYRFLYMNASTHLTLAPGKHANGAAPQKMVPLVFPRRNIYRHQGIIGFTFSGTHVIAGLELALAPSVQSYTMKFGLTF